MSYLVRIKPDCYRDDYSRNSIRFVKYEWRTVDEADMTEAIRSDPFLLIKRVGAESKPAAGEKP